MVAPSPFNACVANSASGDGALRNGAMASDISNSSPVTKRADSTLPSRYFGASAGGAGVMRGSRIAIAQQFVDGAGGLAFAALRACRLRGWRPAINIDMQPAFRSLDEALQGQRTHDRAGESTRRRVVDVGDFRIETAM